MGVLGPTGSDLAQVIAELVLQELDGPGAFDPHRSQVAHVEGHCRRPAGPVLGQSTGGVGQRHQPAAETDQLGLEGPVALLQRRMAQGVRCGCPRWSCLWWG